MCTVKELHEKAMELAEKAMIARYKQDLELARVYARNTFKLESQAAGLLPKGDTSEPTRSILFRSAGWLAFQCKDFEGGIDMVTQGRAGNPPSDVKQELDELLDELLIAIKQQAAAAAESVLTKKGMREEAAVSSDQEEKT